MLILSEQDVGQVYPWPTASSDAIQVIAGVEREIALGRAVLPLRVHLAYPPAGERTSYLRIMPALLPGLGVGATRIYSVADDWVGPKAKERDVYLLFRMEDMALLALIGADRVGIIRTAAPTGLATDLLARPEAREVAVIGSGEHARGQLAAVCTVREIRRARVYSPTRLHRESFAREVAGPLGIDAIPVDSAQQALRGADIVVAATTRSSEPAVQDHWIDEGTHVNSIGTGNEVDEALVLRSRLVLSNRRQFMEDRPARQPFRRMFEEGKLTEDHATELRELLTGEAKARQSPREISLFASAGSPAWDAAIASRVYELARRGGIGTDVSLA